MSGVTFDVYPEQTLGSSVNRDRARPVTALSILRLIPQPPGRIVDLLPASPSFLASGRFGGESAGHRQVFGGLVVLPMSAAGGVAVH
ncbi:MAG: hypothetical protein ACRDZ4_13180, partial [Egibacteraceae bacterium]